MNFHTQVEIGNNIQREICSQIWRDNTLIKRFELQYERPQGEGDSVCEAEGKGQK